MVKQYNRLGEGIFHLLKMLFFIFFAQAVYGQETDSLKLKPVLSGQWRNYYMSTINKGELKDFYSIATGGKVKYVQPIGKKITVGAAIYTSINTGIQDLTIPDETTNRLSRYEAGLFDVTDLSKRLILLPGELYFDFKAKQHQLTIGRMLAKTPFLNGQDGRMIPTLEQGVWYSFKPTKQHVFEVAVFNEIAARSTGEFMNIGESIGTYPVGRNPDGSPSGYAGNTTSDYLALIHGKWQATTQFKLETWDYFVDNLFNMFYVNPTFKLGENGTSLGLQWVFQQRVGKGGNTIDSLRYFSNRASHVLAVQLQFKVNKATVSLAYSDILNKGRFLFPREWGREFLYSFQKRERSEGAAGNKAIVAYYNNQWQIGKSKIQGIFSVGHHWKPNVTDAVANKYAQPDYTHFNIDLFYHSKKLKNLKPELLLTYKKGSGTYPENPNFTFNKVDLFITNFIINYNF